MNKSVEKQVLSHFYDLNKPSAYSGASNIKKYVDVDDETLQQILSSQAPYSLYRGRRYKFRRLRTIPTGFMVDLQCDLADFKKLKRFNKGNAYCLLVVDIMSRQIYASPVRTKKFVDMRNAFDAILEKLPKTPTTIFSDRGREFESRDMHAYFKEHKILKYHSKHVATKASVCERYIRVLKSRIYKYMASKPTKTWYDVLDKFTNGINNSFCRAIGQTPASVNGDNWWPLWKKLYAYHKHDLKTKLKIGDHVRLALNRKAFQKGYLSHYTDEVFKITHVFQSNPITFEISDLNGEPVTRRVYREELSLSDKNTEYRVEKVLRTRTNDDGIKEYFIKWLNLPATHNSWIQNVDFRDIFSRATQ